jgi:predicted nucleic acid-binding protein
MVIVDTMVWIDYFNGIRTLQTDWLDIQLGRQRLGLTDLILCEVLQGVRDDRQWQQLRRDLLKLEVFETGGIGLAVAAAQNYRTLRQQGRTVRKTVDCSIATFCLINNHELLHNDRDYDAFEQLLGLKVIHP